MISALTYADEAPVAEAAAGWFDAATRLPGPAFWTAVLDTEAARWARYHHPATVVLAEIVGLAEVGQAWGREVAQWRATAVARTLRAGCRASDYLVRLDVARFALLLTETEEIAAINMVERVRVACERTLEGVVGETWVAFGWASPTVLGSLLDAAAQAEERLRLEVAAGRP